jgi:photosystem II stability/assembly factor-like uncharacterized protein
MRSPVRTSTLVLLATVAVLALALLQLPLPGVAVENAAAASSTGWEDLTRVPGGRDLYAVDAVNGEIAWAVGVFGAIFNTVDGGKTWTQQESGTEASLASVAAVDTTTAWAGGNVLLKTTDGGGTWEFQDEAMDAFRGGQQPMSMTISGMSVVDADTMWVSVNYIYPGRTTPFGLWYEAAIWKTDDAGTTWTRMLLTTIPPHVNEVYAVSDQVIWAAGGSSGWASPYPAVFLTTDGGATWAYRYLGFPGDISMQDVVAYDALNAWSVYAYVSGGAGGVKKTSDGGANWLTQPAPAGIIPKALSAPDGNTLWVVGSAGSIFKTINGGASWITQSSGVTTYLYDVCAVDTNTAWAVGEAGVILKTTDGGGGVIPQLSVTSITPTQGAQYTFAMNVDDLAGTGFQPGAAVRLEKGAAVIQAYNVSVVSGEKITCTVGLFAAEPGIYDVVITNPDGQEARLTGGFTVTSACGAGSGTALLMLGLTLGLLSLAGSLRLRREKGSR